MRYRKQNRFTHKRRKYSTKKPGLPRWKKINPGDLIFFKEDTAVFIVDEETKEYNKKLQRVICSDEPIVYGKRVKRAGRFFHYFTCLGLSYAYCGPYKSFRKAEINLDN